MYAYARSTSREESRMSECMVCGDPGHGENFSQCGTDYKGRPKHICPPCSKVVNEVFAIVGRPLV